jgi:Asp-tRNA(Asn)/Glu-tRNA(Gln) amidotransferase A subunit family amidase
VHRALYPERADEYGETVAWKLEQCFAVTDGEVLTAQRLREEYRERCAEAVSGVDLVLTPTIGFGPPPADVDEREVRRATIRLTYPLDALGWPALALPCGLDDHGLPVSVQLAAPSGRDALVLAIGALLEQALA